MPALAPGTPNAAMTNRPVTAVRTTHAGKTTRPGPAWQGTRVIPAEQFRSYIPTPVPRLCVRAQHLRAAAAQVLRSFTGSDTLSLTVDFAAGGVRGTGTVPANTVPMGGRPTPRPRARPAVPRVRRDPLPRCRRPRPQPRPAIGTTPGTRPKPTSSHRRRLRQKRGAEGHFPSPRLVLQQPRWVSSSRRWTRCCRTSRRRTTSARSRSRLTTCARTTSGLTRPRWTTSAPTTSGPTRWCRSSCWR